jgi:BMFP domain-containing protein YqiC
MLHALMADKRDIRPEDDESEGIGGIVDELASSWLVGDALTRIVETGEKAFRAQQTALSALGLPSGSQFESLTLRVRTIFHRIEELEDELDRVSQRVSALEAKAKAKPAAKPKPAAKRATK